MGITVSIGTRHHHCNIGCVFVWTSLRDQSIWPIYEVVVFQASVGDCSIPRLYRFSYHFYSIPPPHLSSPLYGLFCFPLSYRPPSVAVVVIAPLIYTRSTPPFLVWNAVYLYVAHTHPPPSYASRSEPRTTCLRLPPYPTMFAPRCLPRLAPRSLSSPGVSPAASPSAPLCPSYLHVWWYSSRHLLGLGSVGCPFCARTRGPGASTLW